MTSPHWRTTTVLWPLRYWRRWNNTNLLKHLLVPHSGSFGGSRCVTGVVAWRPSSFKVAINVCLFCSHKTTSSETCLQISTNASGKESSSESVLLNVLACTACWRRGSGSRYNLGSFPPLLPADVSWPLTWPSTMRSSTSSSPSCRPLTSPTGTTRTWWECKTITFMHRRGRIHTFPLGLGVRFLSFNPVGTAQTCQHGMNLQNCIYSWIKGSS